MSYLLFPPENSLQLFDPVIDSMKKKFLMKDFLINQL